VAAQGQPSPGRASALPCKERRENSGNTRKPTWPTSLLKWVGIREISYFTIELPPKRVPNTGMKPAIPLLAILSLLVVPVYGEEGVADYWWSSESAKDGVFRVVDMKHACKIVATEGKISLFRENGGKLEEYFTSENPKLISAIKQQIVYAPSVYVTGEDGVSLKVQAATSLEIGGSWCSLRAGLVEFGRVTDSAQIKKVLQILGYEAIPGGRFK
jgi:hypothetical protein